MPSPEKLHERARAGVAEQRRLLVSLATGSIAVFFLSLTSEIKPELTKTQKGAITLALLFMSLAVAAGLRSWQHESQWSYCWAKELGAEESGERKVLNARRMRHYGLMEKANHYLRRFFQGGVLCAAFYVLARLLVL